jgi:AcrR family transcriptional regulator
MPKSNVDTQKPAGNRGRNSDGRQRILAAAIQLFGERDYGDVSTQDIAERAGVSRRLMWYHFKTKEEIRDDTDAIVLEALGRLPLLAASATIAENFQIVARTLSGQADYTLKVRYLQRMLMDTGPRGEAAMACLLARLALYDELIDPAKCTAEEREREIIALSVLAGPILLRHHLERHYGVDVNSAEETVVRAEAQSKVYAMLMQRN